MIFTQTNSRKVFTVIIWSELSVRGCGIVLEGHVTTGM